MKSRIGFVLMVLLLIAPTLHAQGVTWQDRFNHQLGITFTLPPNYELLPGDDVIYSNGSNTITFEPVTSLFIHSLDLEEACNIVSLDTPGYNARVLGKGQHGVCIYSKGRQSYTTIVTEDHRYLQGGAEYDYLVVKAPKEDLVNVTDSIQFVDRVNAHLYLDEALRLIRVNFVYPDSVDWSKLSQQALDMVTDDYDMTEAYSALDYVFDQIKGFSAHKGGLLPPDEDSYSLYEIQDRLGYVLTSPHIGRYRTVMLVYPDSPAEYAGLRVGDVVETINGKDARFVNEPQRRKVTLGVRRAGEGETLTIGIIPDYYESYLPVEGRRLDNKLGYIETFSASFRNSYDYLYQYPADAQNTIRSIDEDGTCGWVVDVRRNHGGLALVMGLALGPLRGEGRWFGMRSVTGDITWYDYQYGAFPDVSDQLVIYDPYQLQEPNPPIAVLVSAETASMGEMTAYIMQSRPNAHTRIFGEPTGGYLSDAFTLVSLIDGAQLALVNDRGVGPDRQLLPYSIQPDVQIKTDYTAYGTDSDRVLSAARQWLLEQPECG
ncbi:MAG: S41 family peptidase [Anaerolineae bacterium]